jgi:hypothetical protein
MTVSELTRETVALHLVSAENRDAERLLPALAGAEAWIEAHTDARGAGRAVADFRAALIAAGAAALDGGDPQRVEDALRAEGHAEIPAMEVGLAILSPLRELDEVAYLRFASVYRSFDTLEDFEAEIALLRAEGDATGEEPTALTAAVINDHRAR